MKTAVCGSGPGAMAIAAHLAEAGRSTTIVDRPEFASNVAAISARGGVEARSGWWGARVLPVEATHDVIGTVADADLVVISVPASAHETWVSEVAPVLRAGATLLFMGEGSGSLVARRVLLDADRPDLLVGETNCLPMIARAAAPASWSARRRRAGS